MYILNNVHVHDNWQLKSDPLASAPRRQGGRISVASSVDLHCIYIIHTMYIIIMYM